MSKRGINIYRRKDNRWEGRVYNPHTKKYKSVYGKTYSEARHKLNKLRQDLSVNATDCHCNFSDILHNWLEQSNPHIKASSYECYATKLRLHIIPYFEKTKYRNLTSVHIERFIADKLTSGLSVRYVGDMVIVMKTAAKWAERMYGYTNKIKFVQIPKAKCHEPELLNTSDRQKLLCYLDNNENLITLGIYLTLFTGLRIGELCALKWKDIDFEERVLYVRKTLQRISVRNQKSKTAVIVTSPKTVNSIRDIPLPKFVLDKLKMYYSRNEDFVLSCSHNPIEPRCLNYKFKTLLKKAKVPSINFHALRHTFATFCLQQNFDIKTLSEILGHSTAETTMRIYVHTSMERKRACMEKISPVV